MFGANSMLMSEMLSLVKILERQAKWPNTDIVPHLTTCSLRGVEFYFKRS